MRVLLINPIIRPKYPPINFPLGLGYIARSLLDDGHEVEIMDINAYRWPNDVVAQKIRSAEFHIAGITGLIPEYKYIKWLASTIREYHPETTIVLGGGLATSLPELTLKNTETDIVVIGEGERTVVELTDAIEKKSDLSVVKGIMYETDRRLVHNQPRELLKSLDEIGFPPWKLFPMEIYTRTKKIGFHETMRTMNIIATRGCPFKCIYCDHTTFGYKYRYRSVDNVVREIKLLKQNYRLDGILFSDDIFVLNKKYVREFSEQMLKGNANILWACNARVDTVDREALKIMKRAGCCEILYGLESGSQKILDVMNKGYTVEKAKETIRLTREVGIRTEGYFMIGMIGETEATIKETVEFCKELDLPAQFSIVTPFPNTPLFKQAIESERIREVEDLLERWDVWSETLLVNLTDMSNDELFDIKKKAEQEIRLSFEKKYEKKLIKIINFYKNYGLTVSFRIAIDKIKREIRKKYKHNLIFFSNILKIFNR